MPVITALDKKTIAKIAAGEVVERPLSAVKELVENAVDAGSTEITIELQDGGQRLIAISDNGKGMAPDDVALCTESHTTSKLKGIEDLESLSTLGFRGEALHSIASVSHLVITSRADGSDIGHRIKVEGGTAVLSEPAARARGTTVEVHNLFFNVPVRRKFLKSPRTELQTITTLVSNFTIALPEIAFRLTHNGSEILSTPAAETRMERLRQVMGKDIAAYIEHSGGSLKNMELTAYFGMPDLSFSNRKYQTFFVNGHIVKDRTMSMAVDVAYKGLISGGRYPLSILFLEIAPSEADFNVHPAKTEIRFARTHDVHSLIYRVLRGRFAQAPAPQPEKPFTLIKRPGVPEDAPVEQPPADPGDVHVPTISPDFRKTKPEIRISPTGKEPPAPPASKEFNLTAPWEEAPQKREDDTLDRELAQQAELALMPEPATAAGDKTKSVRASSFTVLGQFFNTFILVNMDGKPVFIDQHIASERTIYNRLKRSTASRPSQMMLLGEPVELPRHAHSVLMDNLELVRRAGLEVEPFGDRALIVRSVVHNAGSLDPATLLLHLANEISSAPYAIETEDLLDRLYVAASCELAVQGGQKLTPEAMQSLISEYLEEGFNRTCPHGRPIIHEVSLEELKAWFKR